MSRVSKSKKPTANAMRIQAEENRKMFENIKPLKLPSNNINKIKDKIKNIFKKENKKNQKEKPGYFKKREDSKVAQININKKQTWNY